jgi:general secretion pathway protein D
VSVILAAVFVTACTLPNEQLSFPGPITGAGPSGGITTGGVGKSVPLGNPADPEAARPRSYPGDTGFINASKFTPTRATASAGEGGITLDLVNASPAEAAKAVLGDVLGANYVVSDKVKAPITLKTASPVSQADLLQIFEAALSVSGAALISDGAAYKIVPIEEAALTGKPVRTIGAPGRRGPGQVTEVVPLKFVAAAEMERILRSVAPQGGISHVDNSRNLLMLTGTSAELQTMVETIRIFDVDWMKGMSFGIYPVETNDVEAIAKELDTVFANDSESPTKGMVKFVPNARLKAILVITSRPAYLKKAETWINRIDMMGRATEKQAFVYHVQHRPAHELAQLLQKLYSPRRQATATSTLSTSGVTTTGAISQGTGGEAFGPEAPAPIPTQSPISGGPQPLAPQGPMTTTATGAPIQQPAPPPGEDQTTATGETNQLAVSADGTAQAPPDDVNSGISIVADEANNKIIVSATPSQIRRIKQVLAQIDVMPDQVLLEATIAEVTLNDDLKFGLRWFFEHGGSQFRLTDSTLGAISPVFPGFSYFLNLTDIRVALNALASITNVNVVSSPSMMVIDNKKAVLQIGDEVPIATQSAVSVVTPDAPIVNSITYQNTGVILSITPRVSDNGRVLLDIEQEVSDVKETDSSGIDSPTIQQRRVKTTVSVTNGETIALAGFMQDRATRDRGQVPVIGDIPLLGNAFKNKHDTVERTELLIAITPHVVQNDGQAAQIAAEFRDRLNLNTRPQRDTPPEFRENIDRLVR